MPDLLILVLNMELIDAEVLDVILLVFVDFAFIVVFDFEVVGPEVAKHDERSLLTTKRVKYFLGNFWQLVNFLDFCIDVLDFLENFILWVQSLKDAYLN